MKLLTIIGIIVTIYIVYRLVLRFNSYTKRKYKYIFFNEKSLLIVSPAYALLVTGYLFYIDALKYNGDILNGLILLFIGALLLLKVIYTNFDNTDLIIGVLGTIFQFLVYIFLSVFSVIVLFVAAIAFAQIKPVYNINSK